MRRSAVVVILVLTQSSFAWSQSPVETIATSPNENPTTSGQLPPRTVPSRPDPVAIRDVAKATPEPPKKLRAGSPDRDLLSKHWALGASISYGAPFGSFTSRSPIGRRFGGATFWGLNVGYGLTRHVQLSLFGEYSHVASGSTCSACDGNSYLLGSNLRYHLIEGTRFDPWVSYGAAYRYISLNNSSDSDTFSAFEPIRFEFGGDWYASSVFALGPVFSIGVDRTVDTSDTANARWSTWLSFGLRMSLDPKGR